MAWSQTSGTKVVANIIPTSPSDRYPTHHSIFGRGGYKTVQSIEERDSIPIDRLTIGSVVRVYNEGVEYVVTALPVNIDSNTHSGKDCTWEPVKIDGLDEEALSALKGKPNGIAPLDEESKVPVDNSRAVIFKGYYINETTFLRNKEKQEPHPLVDHGLYIDKDTHFIYSCTSGILFRDTQYWHDI